MKAHQRKVLRQAFSLTLLLSALLSWNVMIGCGQETAPKRGFQAGGSFALSDIESINTTNGNMMMHFPLASLPVGRGGLSAGINLIYNSKLYNSHTSWYQDHFAGKFGCPPEGCFYQKDQLGFTNDGGWNYTMSYWLEVIDRGIDGSIDPTLHCANGIYLDSGYLPRTYVFKLKMHFPDGSTHELRPSGFTDHNPDDPLGDYYNVRPDGLIWDCSTGVSWTSSTISYYSTDGTYLRLDVQHDGDDNPTNNPWTLYLPDGSRVTGGNAPQRIYDRNNNYVEINNVDNYQGTGHPASVLTDQLGRSVAVENNRAATGEDWIHVQGFGEELVTKVHWGSVDVGKTYWPCPEAGGMSCQTHDGGQQQTPDYFPAQLSSVDRITLPVQAGNLSYTFSYNAPLNSGTWPPAPSSGWGELSGITLPSGAQATYQFYQDGDPNGILSTPDVLQNYPTAKHLVYRPEYDGTTVSNTPCNPQTETCTTENWSYSTADNGGGGSVTSPDGGVSTDYAIATNYSVSWQAWNVGMVYKSIHPDGSMTERIWAKNKLGDYGTYESMRGDNPYVKTEFTSIKNAAGTYVKTAIKDYTYDKNGNVTSVQEYDWVNYSDVYRNSNGFPTGDLSNLQPTRVTTNNYYATTPDASQSPVGGNIYWFQSAPQLKNAVASNELRDGSGNVFSRSELTYDNPLTTGNVTQKTGWDSTKGPCTSQLTPSNSISVSSQYVDWSNGAHGKLIQTTDARGTITVLTYDPVGGFDLYPTQTVTASGTSIARTETRAYDFNTGLVTSATDADNNVTASTDFDVFGRPKLQKAAVGKPEETRTRTAYDDTLRRVIVYSDLNTLGDEKLVAIQHYDQLGRVRLARQLEDSTTQSATDETAGIKVQTRYLFSGANSYTLSSNPYRATTSQNASSETTMGWTRSTSDNTGRMVEVQTFGGSSLPAPWGTSTTSTGTVTTAYDANFTTVTDQALRMRRSMTNGLGQLVRVDEPGDPNTNNSLGTTDNPAQPTSYVYDVLGNLRQVVQGQQQRFFMYDSLSRLMRVRNPEQLVNSSLGITDPVTNNSQWCMAYDYDDNGNLSHKTDARGVVSSYLYDVLNRNYSISYTNDPANTPTVTRTYDNPTIGAYGIGRIWKTQTSGSSGTFVTIDSYDPLGRPKSQGQQFYYNNTWTQPYSISSITYDRAGHLLSETYPSGRVVTNAFDNAGRLSSLTGDLGGGTTRTYSSITGSNAYDAAGHWTREQFGTDTPLYNKRHYNNREQLYDMRLSTVNDDGDGNRGAIVNYYSLANFWGVGATGTDTNGNLYAQQHWVPDGQGGWTIHQQNYDYDSLNRLRWMAEYLNAATNTGGQSYSYDRYGNRTLSGSGAGINAQQFSIDTNTNRLGVPAGQSGTMNYDPAGNLTYDSYSGEGTRAYDGENRMKQAWANNQWQTYSYDGDGRRVKRNVNGTETWQVYGLGGELLAEYAANAAATSPQKEYGYRNGELLVTAEAAATGPRTNVALAGNGGTTVSSSSYSGYNASFANDGSRRAINLAEWIDNTYQSFPDWLEVDFNGSKTIDEIDVIAQQDDYQNPVEPTLAQTFSLYGLTAYEVQYWNGSAWMAVPNGSVSGNNKVWRQFSFSAITTNKIRVIVNAGADNSFSRVVELEAYGTPAGSARTNFGLAANGGAATASSQESPYTTNYANDGERLGYLSGHYSFWRDATASAWPDWLQIDLNGSKTIDEIDVLTVQDNAETPTEPTESMTFSLHGITDFDVQYWNGSGWTTVPGGSVSGNDKVWRKFAFAAVTTSKIRVTVNNALNTRSRIVELEAWGTASGGGSSQSATIQWLVTDQLGTPRMIADQTGGLAGVKRHDYLPFGEELYAGISNRTAQQGYTGDSVRQKFTQKERDNETGLDYFLARYYSSIQGRFTSPDEFKGGPEELYKFADAASDNPTFYANLRNPQSLNKYQYAYNNPLRYVDPDGHDPDSEPEPQDPACPCKSLPTDQQIKRDIDNAFQKAHDALVPVGNAIVKAVSTVVIASMSVQMVANNPGSVVNSEGDVNAIPAVQVAPIVPLTVTPAQTQAKAKPTTQPLTGPDKAKADRERKRSDPRDKAQRKQDRQDRAKRKTGPNDPHDKEGPHHRRPDPKTIRPARRFEE